ncbi:MAG: DUF3343 domain-containing protein [Oscillospiraceae bacterium]|nr:DUF3343 domain-containing protein [Oscillospiraceae bacterium]
MEFYLLALRSLTYAQRARDILGAAGIRAAVIKTPSGVSPKGCSHSLKVRSQEAARAAAHLRSQGINIEKIFAATGSGNYLEVPL